MKPINVSVRVDRPREEVFAFLDVIANHVQFTDHMLVEWSFGGPAAGIGATARVRANMRGEQWMDITVLESVAPVRTVEESVGANGRRRTRGTYTLAEVPGGATEVCFRLEYLETPRAERLAWPLIRWYMTRENAKAMRRLRETLEQRTGPADLPAPTPAPTPASAPPVADGR